MIKKYFPFILVGGIAAAALLFTRKALTALSIIPDFVGIDVKFDGILPYLQVRIRMVNTSSGSLAIQAVNGNIFFNGQYVGRAQSLAAVDIPANSQTIVTLRVTANVTGIVTEIMRYINGDKYNLAAVFLFDGLVSTTGVTVPVKLTYKLL